MQIVDNLVTVRAIRVHKALNDDQRDTSNRGNSMDTLMQQGLELMLLGMGVVFSFLIVLVGCTNLMSWFVNRYFPEAVPAPAAAPAVTASTAAPVEATTLRIIEDAIRQHRARTGRG